MSLQLQLDRKTGQGTLVGLNEKVDQIVYEAVTPLVTQELTDQLITLLLTDEMAIQNAIGNILRSGIQFVLGGDATGDLYYRAAGGPVARLGVGTNGQQLVVSGGLPAWADRSALNWSVITANQAASINSGYIVNAAALATISLPTTAAVGSALEIVGVGAGGWRLGQAAGQQAIFGNIANTLGTGGQLNSTHQRDCIRLVCVVADTTWQVISSIGNIDVI